MGGNLWVFSSTHAVASTLSTFCVWVTTQKRTTPQFGCNFSIPPSEVPKDSWWRDRACQSDHVALSGVRTAALIPAKALQALSRQGYPSTWSCCQVSEACGCPCEAAGVCHQQGWSHSTGQQSVHAGTERAVLVALPRGPGSTLCARAAPYLCHAGLNVLWQGQLPPAPLQWGPGFQIFKHKGGELEDW